MAGMDIPRRITIRPLARHGGAVDRTAIRSRPACPALDRGCETLSKITRLKTGIIVSVLPTGAATTSPRRRSSSMSPSRTAT
eukprot:105383-Prymnesium_polylepis.1